MQIDSILFHNLSESLILRGGCTSPDTPHGGYMKLILHSFNIYSSIVCCKAVEDSSALSYDPYGKQQYLQFFGLSTEPFPVAPDNRNFFISRHTDQIVSNISEAIFYRKGFMLLIGEVGLGKTTLSRRIISILIKNGVEVSLILQSFYQEIDLLKEINKDFGIDISCLENLAAHMERLTDFLLEKNQNNINCAIVIDDAQNLSFKSLELIRMISNLEADRKKLVQILLVGQPELLEKLNANTLRQLKSRVTLLQKPMPLEKEELIRYLKFKLRTAGNNDEKIILEKNAVNKLFKITSGNLRMVNILMDRALMIAFSQKSFTIKTAFIDEACNALEFKRKTEKKIKSSMRTYIFLILIVIILLTVGIAAENFFYINKAEKISLNNGVRKSTENIIITKKIPLKNNIYTSDKEAGEK